VVADAAPICGGIVLEPVRLSAMPERDANCNTLLPADERYTIDFNPRPPGPSGGRLAFAPDPSAPDDTAPADDASLPEDPRAFDLYFDFDRGVSFRHPGGLIAILEAAAESKAQHVGVTGVRGAHRLSDGTLLEESAGIGRRRAEEVAGLLEGAGLEAAIETEWTDSRSDADGIDDWQSRRVTVVLTP
jgi:hypothetical protein